MNFRTSPTHPDRRRTPQDSGGHCAACFGLHPARDSAGQAGLFARTTVESDELPLGGRSDRALQVFAPSRGSPPRPGRLFGRLGERRPSTPAAHARRIAGGDGRVPRLTSRLPLSAGPCPPRRCRSCLPLRSQAPVRQALLWQGDFPPDPLLTVGLRPSRRRRVPPGSGPSALASGSPPPLRPTALPPAAPARASGQPRSPDTVSSAALAPAGDLRRIRRSFRRCRRRPLVRAPGALTPHTPYPGGALQRCSGLRSCLAPRWQGKCPLTPRARARMPRSAPTQPAHPRRPPEPPGDPPANAGFTGGLDSRLGRVGGCFGGRRWRLCPPPPFGLAGASAFRAARPAAACRAARALARPPVRLLPHLPRAYLCGASSFLLAPLATRFAALTCVAPYAAVILPPPSTVRAIRPRAAADRQAFALPACVGLGCRRVRSPARAARRHPAARRSGRILAAQALLR